MALTDQRPSTEPAQTARRRVGDLLLPLVVFAVARVVSGAMLTVAARRQPDLTDYPFWHVEGTRPAGPSYLEILSNWDGQWFKTIALHGYGGVEAAEASGQSALAFSPVYPAVVRAVMAVTGLGFEAAATTVSLLASAAAVVLLFRWLLVTRGRGPAVAAVAVLSFFPAAPVLQAAYSDGLALLLVVVLLRAVAEDRWRVAWAVAPLLALTRPVLLPVALLMLVVRWRAEGGRLRAVLADRRFLARVAGIGALAFLWPVLAGVISGSAAAYSETLKAWRSDGLSVGGWFSGLWTNGLQVPAVLAAVLLVALVALRLRRRVPDGPADHLGTWAGAYLVFVLATAPPNAGIIRHTLLTLVPLGTVGPMAADLPPRRRAVLLGVVVVLEVVLMWLWVRYVFVVADPDAARIP
ncbi:hypothetical protein [Phycicoccus sonneratiae]|uniref:Mannosyltransferase PIG-V n=1 Tax=Phycicoccus sonneratiae TaxID=2807628 RepID=A0ABS2CPF7_9MICO|nr:hypothetical protein [Phycicoccus sonneraticus]MBM6400944.1 hypothetical protein [Phycicoccus sonneraticus]